MAAVMLGRWRHHLLAALVVGAIPACASDGVGDDGDGDGDASEASAVTTGRIPNKSALFATDMFYVRVTSWDSSLMTAASLKEERKVAGAELAMFVADPESKTHCPDAEATSEQLVYKSKEFSLRTSGNLTNGTPKSSYKLGLEDKRDRLFGMSSLNLKSMWNDVSQMREALAWKIFAEAGVRAPRHTYAKLCVNGKYFGLYSMIEQVDKGFLKERFEANDKGNLYKAYWPETTDIGPATLAHRKDGSGDDSGKQYFKSSDNDARTYQLKTNDGNSDPAALKSYDDLAAFIRTLNRAKERDNAFDTDDYARSMEATFDVKGFLRWAGVNSLLGAWDNYWATPANYYLYNAGRRGAEGDFVAKPYWSWIPWDYDNTAGIDYHGGRWQFASIVDWSGASAPYYQGRAKANLPLLTNLLANTKFLRYYLDSIEHLNDAIVNERWLTQQIGDERRGLRRRVQQAALLEADGDGAAHTGRQWTNGEIVKHGFGHEELQRGSQHIDGILHYFRMRHDSVARELATLRIKHPKGSSGATFPAQPTAIP